MFTLNLQWLMRHKNTFTLNRWNEPKTQKKHLTRARTRAKKIWHAEQTAISRVFHSTYWLFSLAQTEHELLDTYSISLVLRYLEKQHEEDSSHHQLLLTVTVAGKHQHQPTSSDDLERHQAKIITCDTNFITVFIRLFADQISFRKNIKRYREKPVSSLVLRRKKKSFKRLTVLSFCCWTASVVCCALAIWPYNQCYGLYITVSCTNTFKGS